LAGLYHRRMDLVDELRDLAERHLSELGDVP
jgi:hypothetical protein